MKDSYEQEWAARRLIEKWRDIANLAKALPSGAINQAALEILTRCADQLEAALDEPTERTNTR